MEVYKKVIKKYGTVNQRRIAQEELAELIQAISKDLRGLRNNVEEEIADVEIVLDQLKMIYSSSIIDAWKGYKLKRLERLIEEE